jgi:hypothetical protein
MSKVFAPTIVAATALALHGCNHHKPTTNTEFEKSVMGHFGLANFTSTNIPLEAFGLPDLLKAYLNATNSTNSTDMSAVQAAEAAAHPHFANSDMYYTKGKVDPTFVHEVYDYTARQGSPPKTWNREFDIVYPPDLKEGQKVGYILNIQCGGMSGLKGETKSSKKNIAMTNVLNWAVNHLGMAVVNLKPDPDDEWFWYEDYLFSDGYDFHCNDENASGMCWNNGSNPDKGYLDTVMHTLHSHKHIDYDNMVLLGYSAGAQMVSAAMSIFPKQSIHKYQSTVAYENVEYATEEAISYPKINGAFMIGGGSQYCYISSDGRGHRAPSIMGQCHGSGGNCCPANATEKIYMDGTLPYSEHPPVVMLQTQKDSNAAHDASIKYYETAAANNVPAVLVTGKGKYHGLVEAQSYIMAKMIQHLIRNTRA